MILSGRRGTVIATLAVAALAGAVLLLPALTFIGSMLDPSEHTPAQRHATPLLGEAIWARAQGGRATELQPINPFTIGRMASCHIWAEQRETRAERDVEHDQCMKLMPGIEGIAYLSTVHMRGEGVWQDPRVPFVQLANMTKLSSTWTRTELVDTLAERGEFGPLFNGAEAAARGYFGHSAMQLSLGEAALLAGVLGDGRADPWCAPERVAAARHRILERMRDSLAIDADAFTAADRAELGVIAIPASHPPCKG